jgi:hypothetical protein
MVIKLSHIFTYDGQQILNKGQNKPRGLSPRANYTDQATAACRQS